MAVTATSLPPNPGHPSATSASQLAGSAVSVVNVAGAHVYQPGDQISILVDPQDPSYSELPGLPDDSSLEALVGCATVLLVVLLGVTGGPVSAFRKRRRRGQRSPSVT